MKLVDVYDDLEVSCVVLHLLLQERKPRESISHKVMPTFEAHCVFVESRPYMAWYLAEAEGFFRGAVYLSHQRDIGVSIFKDHRGHGYALDAVTELMRLHPGRFLWNVAPLNTPSIALARKLGFGPVPVQYTYAKETE